MLMLVIAHNLSIMVLLFVVYEQTADNRVSVGGVGFISLDLLNEVVHIALLLFFQLGRASLTTLLVLIELEVLITIGGVIFIKYVLILGDTVPSRQSLDHLSIGALVILQLQLVGVLLYDIDL